MGRADEKGNSVAYRVPAELVEAMEAMRGGKLSFAKFRDDLANSLYLDFRIARHLETWLHECEASGELPSHLHRVLESDVQRICAEDVPTLIDTEMARAERQSNAGARQSADRAVSPSDPTDAAINRMPADVADLASRRVVKVGDVLADRYEILAKADGGNMSTVFKAKDRKAAGTKDEFCAIKLLLPEMSTNGRALRALQDEYEKGALLDHPNVVRYRALERDGALIFVTMEWLDGETLATELNRAPGMPAMLSKTRRVISQVVAALDAVHNAGLVHADLKPGNVMVLPDGKIKLFDFGVARAFGALREQRIGFDAGVLAAATPAYASARVLDGDLPTPTDDYYSLACIAYRMLAGVRVFGSQNANQACADKTPIPPLDSLSEDNFDLFVQYLSHDSGQRPISSSQLLQSLQAPVERIDGELPFIGGSGKFWLAGAAAVVLASVVVVGGFSRGEKQAEVRPVVTSNSETPISDDEISRGQSELVANVPSTEAPSPSEPLADPAEVSPAMNATTVNNPATDSLPTVDQSVDEPIADTTSGATFTQISLSSAAALEVGRITVRPTDGPVNVELVTSEFSEGADVRVYLLPERNSPPHTLLLNAPTEGRISSAGSMNVQLTPFSSGGLDLHRKYRLVVVGIEDPAAVYGALDIVVMNQALENLASRSGNNLVGFTETDLSVVEGAGAVRVNIARLNGAAESWRGQVVVSAMSATEYDDYFAPATETLVFAPGEEVQTLLLPLVNDGVAENEEVFAIEIVSEAIATGLSHSVTVTIIDDDGVSTGL